MFPSLLKYHSRPYRALLCVATAIACLLFLFASGSGGSLAIPAGPIAYLVAAGLSAAIGYGQYRLNKFINNRRPGKVDKGRNDDARIQGSEYGASIPIVFGRVRLAGNIVWTSGIQVSTSTSQGARRKKGGATDTTTYTYTTGLAILLCRGVVTNGVRKIWADGELILNRDATGSGGGDGTKRDVTGVIVPEDPYPVDLDNPSDFYNVTDTDTTHFHYGSLSFGSYKVYKGTPDQPQDSMLIASLGVDDTPAYRNRAVCMLHMRLKDGRLPNFNFELDEGTSDVDDMLTKLYALVGIPASDLDLTALSGLTCNGLLIFNRQQAKAAIEDFESLYHFDMVEVDGKLKAVMRDGASVATLTTDDLRAHAQGEQMPPCDLEIEDAEELSLPNRIDVDYLDPTPGVDYHSNVQRARRAIGNTQDPVRVSYPVTMQPDQARQQAEYLLAQAHVESRPYEFSAAPKWVKLHPNDVITIVGPGSTHFIRITEQQFNLPHSQVKLKGVQQQAPIANQSATGSAGSGLEAAIVPFPGNQKLVILESPPIHDGDDRLIVYGTSALRGDGADRGAFLYRATPAGDYDDLIATFPEQGTVGVTDSVLANAEPHSFDSTSSLLINFYQGTLSSCTQDELVADPYKNLLGVKNPDGEVEYVQFTTATPATASWPYRARYTVSGFLRGRFATEAAAESHDAGCDVVLMNGRVQTIEFEPTEVGRTLRLKSVSAGQQIVDAEEVEHTLTGRSLSPHAAVNLTGTRNSDGDLLIEYTRRGRLASFNRGFNSPPLSEEREEWAVDVLDGGGQLVRRIPVVPPYQTDAVLESDRTPGAKYDGISGNTAQGQGTTLLDAVTFQYASLQRITRAGNFAAATLVTGSSVGVAPLARFGLLDASVEWRGANTGSLTEAGLGITPFIVIRFDGTTTSIYVNGAEEYSSTAHASGTRWTFELSGASVKVYADRKGRTSVPVYTTAVAPSYPLRVFGSVRRSGCSVGDVSLTTSPEPKAVYTAAEQEQDFGSTQSSVTVRVRQLSAVVGFGQSTLGTI